MNWNNCFSDKRFGTPSIDTDDRTEYERDWDRIVFSSAFRRLQNKTQVFPLPEEIFVHNRLTHSLEVASVGRSLGKMVGELLIELEEIKKDKKAKAFYRDNLKNVISAACLAHDMGNPAFGHSGEEAISKYFRKRDTDKPEDIIFKNQFSKNEWKDLITFEGNANALRIITQNQKNKPRGGFKLTYSTIGAILKYPCESLASEGKKGKSHRKKYGYFKADESIFIEVCKELNMIDDSNDGFVAFKRHPFVYLVEAADDICYNIIDFEDAHRLGILDYETVRSIFMEIISMNSRIKLEHIEQRLEEYKDDRNECVAYLRANCISTLTNKCAAVFFENRDDIIKGNYEKALIDDIPEFKDIFKRLTEINIRQIYNNKKVVEIEIAGFRIMSVLVEDFVTSALTPAEKREKEQQKILALLPNQFAFDENDTSYNKTMKILDFISGMTDLYALKLFRKLRGIEL